MKVKDLIGLNGDELRDKLQDLQKQIYDLNFQRRSGKVEKPHLFKVLKRDIARILTVLNVREHEERE